MRIRRESSKVNQRREYHITMLLVSSLLAIVCCLVPQAESNTLLSVVQVFRHGQRVPITFYANDPYSNASYWPADPGQLTSTGKTQHYTLGNFTRQRYGEWLGSFSVDTFRAQTTDIDRTHMSAQCNVAGLFPPTSSDIWNEDIYWQPIPIHPSDTTVMSSSTNCNAYSEELTRVLTEETYYQDIDTEYASVYEYITENSGSNVTTVSQIGTVYDSLFIENDIGYTLPSWTNSVFPDPITTIEGYQFQSLAYNTKLQRLSTGVFIDTLINHFDDMKDSTSAPPKYQMYSAHDTNIAQILSTLGVFEPHAPYFASTIYFELRQILGVYVVNVYHKNKDTIEKVTVKGCVLFNCPLIEFKNLMKDIRLDAATWETECAETSNITVSTSVQDLLLRFHS